MEQELISAGWVHDHDDGFVGHVGGLWRRAHNGQMQFALIARDFHANRNGVVHGGMLVTFMDRALGQTSRMTTGAVRGATINLNTQFLAPVKIGDLVVMTPQITKVTSRMVFASGTAFVGDDPVAAVQGVFRASHSKA